MRNDIGQDDKGQEKQGSDDLAARMAQGEPNDHGAPGQEEPCFGVIPFHEINVGQFMDGFKSWR